MASLTGPARPTGRKHTSIYPSGSPRFLTFIHLTHTDCMATIDVSVRVPLSECSGFPVWGLLSELMDFQTHGVIMLLAWFLLGSHAVAPDPGAPSHIRDVPVTVVDVPAS